MQARPARSKQRLGSPTPRMRTLASPLESKQEWRRKGFQKQAPLRWDWFLVVGRMERNQEKLPGQAPSLVQQQASAELEYGAATGAPLPQAPERDQSEAGRES